MKRKITQYTIKSCIVLFASLFMGLGISMVYKANIGSDPGGILGQAISFRTGLSVGVVGILFNAAVVAIFAFITPKRIGISTIVLVIFVGTGTDLSALAVYLLPDFNFWGSAVLNGLGAAIIGLAVAIYLPCSIGASAYDIVILFVQDVTKRSYRTASYITYFVFGATGILLGGVWGWGSVIAMLVTGFVADRGIPVFRKLYAWWFPAIEQQETPEPI